MLTQPCGILQLPTSVFSLIFMMILMYLRINMPNDIVNKKYSIRICFLIGEGQPEIKRILNFVFARPAFL